MSWVVLGIAGLLETVWAYGLKCSEGFTKLGASVFTLVTMAASIYFLSLALKTLPLGTAYAVWTGIGTIGTVILGIVMFKESVDLPRIICVLLIVAGIVGLKLVSSH